MANLTQLHKNNISLVLQTLFLYEPIARHEIAKMTHLTRTSISTIINDLIDIGLVKEHSKSEASKNGGRKAILLKLEKNKFATIGLDIRREKIIGTLINFKGDIIQFDSQEFPEEPSKEFVWNTINNMIISFLNNKGKIPVIGIGVGIIGPLDLKEGKLLNLLNFDALKYTPFKQILEDKFNLPVIVQTGAGAGALGEYFWQKIKSNRYLAFIEIDYGLGMALVANGEIAQHGTGSAGEIGHITISYDGPLCECGRRGCLDFFASGKSLFNKVSKDKYSNLGDIVFAAENGNNNIQKILIDAGYMLGYGIMDIQNLLMPERIVIGSSHENLNKWYLKGIEKHLDDNSSFCPDKGGKLQLSVSTKGAKSIAYGAATLILKGFLDNPLNSINILTNIQ